MAQKIMGEIRDVFGWVEIDKRGQVVVGKIGVRVYRFKKDIVAEGFSENRIAPIALRRTRPTKESTEILRGDYKPYRSS